MSQDGRFAGRVAIVTGGAAGIGLATTRKFVAEGARVVIGDVDEEALASVGKEFPDSVVAQRCDVRAERDIEALAATAMSAYGRLDVAFANAGIGGLAPVVDVDAAEWMRVVEVNLLGPLLTIKHAARNMASGGSIVLTASLNAVQPAHGMSAYCCSKASLVEDFAENAPLGRASTPEEVANLVAFLASDDSSAMSGSLHLVDGGAHTGRYPNVLGHLAELG
jgi:NAD(P)-dependent dehydrogenase (short-subunit alcohol dehydrogenase family)